MPDILYAAFNRNAESNNAFTAALVPSTQALKIKTHNHMLLATYEVFINTKLRYIQRFYIPYSVLCHMTITRIQRSKDLWIACESRHCYIACLCLCFCCCFFSSLLQYVHTFKSVGSHNSVYETINECHMYVVYGCAKRRMQKRTQKSSIK